MSSAESVSEEMTDKPNPTYGQSRLLRLELTSSHRPSTTEEQVGAGQMRNTYKNWTPKER
jgi:hypothetical protein